MNENQPEYEHIEDLNHTLRPEIDQARSRDRPTNHDNPPWSAWFTYGAEPQTIKEFLHLKTREWQFRGPKTETQPTGPKYDPSNILENLILGAIAEAYRQLSPDTTYNKISYRTLTKTREKLQEQLQHLQKAYGKEISETEITAWEKDVEECYS